MHSAFVLAAGLGTRLRPLTEVHPKPLVPVCGVPLLAYSLALCARHGLTDVVVNAHWLAPQLEAWAGEREGVQVSVSTELPEVLGTGGGLRKVADRLASPFVVLNGDVLHDVDLTALRAAVASGGAALALRSDPANAPRYGVVAADSTGRVVRLTNVANAQPAGDVDETTHFTGIHAMSREALDLVPEGFQCVIRTAYKALVPERRVIGVPYSGVWLDAGDPASYLDANRTLLSGDVRTALDPFARAAWARARNGRVVGDDAAVRGVSVVGGAWVGPGARVGAGARLEDVVLGANAAVRAGVSLRNVVVWEGGEVTEDLHDAIVYPGGVVRVG